MSTNRTEYLFDAWHDVDVSLRRSALMLFLDYDGTLTPIAARPERAELSPLTREVLAALTALEGVDVSIVSGRSLEQIKALVEIDGLTYVGNHGFEIEGPGVTYIHPGAREAAGQIKEAAGMLEKALGSVPGILIEDKTLTLSVHYRQVAEGDISRVRMVFSEMIRPFVDKKCMVVTEGKKVLELRPAVAWDKGSAVTWLLQHRRTDPSRSVFPVYVGDDETDESAFRALRGSGLGIKIVSAVSRSSAEYYLRNAGEVYDFLKRVYALKKSTHQEA